MSGHHHHVHGHSHPEKSNAQRNLLVALLLNLSFAIIELAGGLYTNSVAILSDALHDAGDALSLGVAWYLEKVSHKPRDHLYSYGYRRFSLLGALVVSSVLLIGVALVIRESVVRLLHPQVADAKGMLWLAILGIAVNGFAALRVKSGQSLSERAVYLHLLEDVLGWVAVLISSGLMVFFNLPFLDPLISLAIAAFILFNVFRNLRSVVKILLLEVPQHLRVSQLEHKILGLTNVERIEDLHIFTLDGANHVITLQVIVLAPKSLKTLAAIKKEIRNLLAEEGIRHSTIEFCLASEENHQHH